MQETEAKKIYRAIIYNDVPAAVARRFIDLSTLLNQKMPSAELEYYYRAIQDIDDLEALEIACRYMGKLSTLTQRFRIMVYLAETLPENQYVFINRTSSMIKGVMYIILGALHTVFKFGIGLFLLTKMRHD